MLSESFIASTLRSEKAIAKVNKDIGIHQYDFQPRLSLKSTFKKSSTNQNCLAVSASHIFAAQADKSVIHVYSRERGNQEVVVPFHDRIRSIALAADADGAGVLVLGTDGGGLILWELCTGRQVSTPPSHLHPTTCLTIDPSSNFVLSGSSDSNIHVWSIPSLLAFSESFSNDPNEPDQFHPLQSLSNHRAAINAIETGHSASKSNIAVSAAQDNTCMVWNYIEGQLLHTFLLPSAPLCLALDPADRGFCAGYSDGSIQLVDFYDNPSSTHALHDPALQLIPTQPLSSDHWPLRKGLPSAAFAIQYSYDGTILLSGHENGTVQTWDTAGGQHGSQSIELGAPVTNLKILPPTGFPILETPLLKTLSVIKPRYESLMNGFSSSSHLSIPMDYTFTAQLLAPLSTTPPTSFDLALSSPLFTPSLISASLAYFNDPTSHSASQNLPSQPINGVTDLETQNKLLFTQLEIALQNQRTAIKQVLQLERERHERVKQDERKAGRKRQRRLRRMEAQQLKREALMSSETAKVNAGAGSNLRGIVPRGAMSHGNLQESDEDEDQRKLSGDLAKGSVPEEKTPDFQNQAEPMSDPSSTTDDLIDSD